MTKCGNVMTAVAVLAIVLATAAPSACSADEPIKLDRCEITPLPGRQASFRIDGVERLRWRFGDEFPRPCFYPFKGPSGGSLTRIGHPGAGNHDHHRSVWFAHHDVNGVNFWTNGTDAKIRQKMWYAYRDGNDEAVMASVCGWYDGEGRELMEQDIVAALIPMTGDEHALELQITMRPAKGDETVDLGKTNFGFLAVRVAKTLSVHFGGGALTSSEGQAGEKAIFGKQARWMDYSGPVAVRQGAAERGSKRRTVVEGITYFDHPANPRYPTHWHVRADGWMGASFCMHEGLQITHEKPLTLRYLLHAHRGGYDAARAIAVHEAFAGRAGFEVTKGTRPHYQFEVGRLDKK